MGLYIFTLIITIITGGLQAFGVLKRNNTNRLTLTGYAFWTLTLLSTGASIKQKYDDDKDSGIKRKQDKIETENANTRIRRGIDSGVTANNLFLALALGKQKVDIDSLRLALKNINDSIKRPNIRFENKPVPDLDFNGLDGINLLKRDKDSYMFRLQLLCRDAKAENIKIKIYPVILTTNKGYEKVDSEIMPFEIKKLSKDDVYREEFPINVLSTDSLRMLFLVVKGSYWDNDSKKEFKLYSVRYFDVNKNRTYVRDPTCYPSVYKYLEPEK